jgi:four helix bundle protein
MMKDFRTLIVWQRAHELTLAVYRSTKDFPADERFGLTSQMRRSSSSVPTNIAEGCGRDSNPEFNRFLQIAFGSTSELDYQLILAWDLGFLSAGVHTELKAKLIEVQKMLAALIRKVRSEINR